MSCLAPEGSIPSMSHSDMHPRSHATPVPLQVIDASTLSWSTRIKGFAICFVLGILCSLLVRHSLYSVLLGCEGGRLGLPICKPPFTCSYRGLCSSGCPGRASHSLLYSTLLATWRPSAGEGEHLVGGHYLRGRSNRVLPHAGPREKAGENALMSSVPFW